MCKSIVYREYKECDFNDILKITLNTWEYEKYLSSDTAKLAAELDLLCYLNEHNIIYVAQADDKVIGFIIGRITNEHSNENFNSRICELKAAIRKRKEGLLISFFRHKMSSINQKLLSNSKISYDAELQFFAIDKNYRGLGIGNQLFNMYLDYINNKDAKTFYLYTDTTCNYKFYDKLGMIRKSVFDYKIPFSKRPLAKFYLYDNVK